jgi:signal transduction histidine kinase
VRIVTRNWTVDARRADAELAPGDYVGVSVIDDGEGMSPGVLRRATEPFFTTKGRRGTGLGLSQVYGFVRQVGGALRIESAPGAGTAVHLLFRRAPHGGALTGTGNGR